MDPQANLQEQLAIANRIVNDDDYPHDGDIYNDAERLAELVIALDEWMRKGGFSPWIAYDQDGMRQRKLLIDMVARIPPQDPDWVYPPFGTRIRYDYLLIAIFSFGLGWRSCQLYRRLRG